MSAPQPYRLVVMVIGLCSCPVVTSAQPTDRPAAGEVIEDKPKVAIIQYESGRVLVVREVNGELLVVEPQHNNPAILGRYLSEPGSASPPGQADQPDTSDRDNRYFDTLPLFYSPQWYPHHAVIDPHLHTEITHIERAIERSRQNAAEVRQQVQARRRRQGSTDTTNRAGQVYPSTAADQEHRDRPGTAYPGAGYSPYETFYTLGSELEHYRQQELAARAELSLLTYDVLLKEGLTYFRNRHYAQAARSFIAASQKDHGDASSRLHAAQCLMASSLYEQALAHVRRAFELAPQLIYRPLNHRDNYAFPGDFDRHLEELKRYVSTHLRDDDAVLLLAYEQFFSDRPAQAVKAMRRVKRLAKSDGFAKKLWEAAQPILGDL